MCMGLTQTHGRAGEALAAAYLELAGCTIRARNVRLAGVEVDLIMRDGGTDVIVEVKFRGRRDYGGAAAAIDHMKRARLVRAAHALEQEGSRRVRIDVVAIDLSAEGAAVRHYRSAVTG
jgi:putative endonuclease